MLFLVHFMVFTTFAARKATLVGSGSALSFLPLHRQIKMLIQECITYN